MLTTCPECRTVFRVSQAQLDNKRGLVRCGTCVAVFNAYDTLLPELAQPPEAPPAEPHVGDAVPAPSVTVVVDENPLDEAGMSGDGPPGEVPGDDWAPVAPTGPEPTLADDRDPTGEPAGPEPGPEDLSAASPQVLPETENAVPADGDAPRETGSSPEPEVALPASDPSQDILLTPLHGPDTATPDAGTGRGRIALAAWSLVGLALLGLLAGQLVYFLRGDLARTWPGLRQPLVDACQRLGCDLPLARDLTALRVEASSLESDPEEKAKVTLRLSISNRGALMVDWPHVVLVLTDANDVPLAQRPFAPGEYLGTLPKGGLPSGQEKEIQLALELKGLSAYGYKLELAYP